MNTRPGPSQTERRLAAVPSGAANTGHTHGTPHSPGKPSAPAPSSSSAPSAARPPSLGDEQRSASASSFALDIDRLHRTKSVGTYGRTTDMLVAAVQNSDFSISTDEHGKVTHDPITILAGNEHDAAMIYYRLAQVALALGYHVDDLRPAGPMLHSGRSVKINATWYHIKSNAATLRARDIQRTITFYRGDIETEYTEKGAEE